MACSFIVINLSYNQKSMNHNNFRNNTPQSTFRNSYSHHQAPPIFKPTSHQQAVYKQDPKKYHHMDPKDVKETLKQFSTKIQQIQNKIKQHDKINKNKSGNFSSRNMVQQMGSDQQMNHHIHFNSSINQIDLRGSCPNIYKKFEQTALKNASKAGEYYNFNETHNSKQNQQQSVSNFAKKTSFNQKIVNRQDQIQTYHKNQLDVPKPNISSFCVKSPKANSKSQHYNTSSNDNSRFLINNEENLRNKSSLSTLSSTSFNFKQMVPKQQTNFTSLNEIAQHRQKNKMEKMHKHNMRSPIINGFQIGISLGKGKFGQVFLCRHQDTGCVVALKRIDKSKVKQYKMVEQLKQQIKLHSVLNHPNIVKFFGIFEQPEYIYLILQYMNGGTLFDYLVEKDKLCVQETADFLRDIILALQYMHEKSIAHRDIKPENIVLSAQRVAKLCDFGWSAVVQNSRRTYCGTFDYAPPQILQRKQYDMSVDIWCIGILTYELLTGRVPFEGQARNQVMKKIINVDKSKIYYPTDIPDSAKNFIQQLVQKDPTKRIKCKDLLKHPFFAEYPAITSKHKHK